MRAQQRPHDERDLNQDMQRQKNRGCIIWFVQGTKVSSCWRRHGFDCHAQENRVSHCKKARGQIPKRTIATRSKVPQREKRSLPIINAKPLLQHFDTSLPCQRGIPRVSVGLAE
jgi:hypothetical protein